jgi:hypothetical protein
MKKYFLLFSLAALLSITFIACDDDSTGPDPVGPTGSLRIESSPTGATVFIDGTNRGTTNTTVQNVAVGTRSVRLELEGYRDTTISVVIEEDLETLRQVTLTPSVTAPSLMEYGPVRIYESFGTGAGQPSGLDLSAGTAISSTNPATDLFYFTNSNFSIHEIRSGGTRTTSFFIGSSTNLDDGEDSPLAVPSWLSAVPDRESNYFFAYDADQHYSKIKIVNFSANNEQPAWIEVEWYYNETENDNRF